MTTKFDIVERLSFMRKIYNKLPGSGFTKGTEDNESAEQIELCGVLFYKDCAYSTNNQVICRVAINDDVYVDEPIFWGYSKDEENVERITAEKFLLNCRGYCEPNPEVRHIFSRDFMNNLDVFFDKSADNVIYIRKTDLLNCIDKHFGSNDNRKSKTNVRLNINQSTLSIYFEPYKVTPKNQPILDEISLFTTPAMRGRVQTDGSCCWMNVFYLYEIVKNSFLEYEVVGIKYRDNPDVPVVVFGKNPRKPSICWAIARAD